MSEFANEDSLREVFKLLTGKDGNFDEEKQKIINCTDNQNNILSKELIHEKIVESLLIEQNIKNKSM